MLYVGEYHATVQQGSSTHGIEVTWRSKVSLARYTIIMPRRLPVVIFQAIGAPEGPLTRTAIVVTVVHVGFQIIVVVEMLIAFLTVRVMRALDPMFFQAIPCGEINFAFLTNVMIARVSFVLMKCRIGRKRALAAIAICHNLDYCIGTVS